MLHHFAIFIMIILRNPNHHSSHRISFMPKLQGYAIIELF